MQHPSELVIGLELLPVAVRGQRLDPDKEGVELE